MYLEKDGPGTGRSSERALGDLREAAEAMQSLSVLHIVRVIETMLMICRGEFVHAEQAAHAAFELGTRAQDADALGYLGGHLVTIRWFQGRESEMLDLMAHCHLDAGGRRGPFLVRRVQQRCAVDRQGRNPLAGF